MCNLIRFLIKANRKETVKIIPETVPTSLNEKWGNLLKMKTKKKLIKNACLFLLHIRCLYEMKFFFTAHYYMLILMFMYKEKKIVKSPIHLSTVIIHDAIQHRLIIHVNC